MKLSDRVEALAGPDREVDGCIWYAAVEKPRAGEKLDRDMINRWPTYTSSLDAAMTLVPEGWAWTLFSDGSCEIGYDPESGCLLTPKHTAEAPALALALCAAALRARGL